MPDAIGFNPKNKDKKNKDKEDNFATDIGRKQTEQALPDMGTENECWLRDFAQAVPDASYIIDEDGRFIEVFGNSEKLIPFSPAKLRGQTVYDVFSPEKAKEFLAEIRQTITTQMPRRLDHALEISLTSQFWEGRAAPMQHTVGGKKTVAVVVTDVTERRQAERILQISYELRRRSDFLNDIVNGHVVVDAQVTSFANSLGVDFSAPLFCCLVASEGFNGAGTKRNANANNCQILKNSIIDVLGDEPDCIVWDCRADIGVLYQAKELNKDGSIQFAGRLIDKIRCIASYLAVTIGVGNSQTGPAGLVKSFRQARNAIIAARCDRNSRGGIYHYGDLGIFQLLTTYELKEPARGFVEEKIGKLINYDREKGTNYLDTLEEILQTANLKEAAQNLFLHHKTVVFRKQRIEKILEISVDSFETRIALAAAIKLYRLGRIIVNI
ncbi:MAG TPA: PAS domain S-box protein [Methylomusa anaerophila]|uniref:Carbohydrate diacid transcriptional activator CdaR n=1 Tax=Methylomusa anaerophila TaxID=1930071 RepID=A0A348AGD9_9FIRM|nr:PAS domain S-box protein [Methylomusa anaerophila]BBB90137.1 carbohydrate diacid transcriptional activator CdaR [Methylomusa anaerophila]HML88139.1 PAS domain S-box protein [Methylomusa anaerophila]